ncbi:MAG: hypothetical protein SFV15_12055 [Polyangiaceae bacterium]|nr:hypothetical protein [Polyangiaceae bacterium]
MARAFKLLVGGSMAVAVVYACADPSASNGSRYGGLNPSEGQGGSGGSQTVASGGAPAAGVGGRGDQTGVGGAAPSGGSGGASVGGASLGGAPAQGGVGGVGGTLSGGSSSGGTLPDPGNVNLTRRDSGENGCGPELGCGGVVGLGSPGTALREFWADVPLPGYMGNHDQVASFTNCAFSPNFPDNPTLVGQMVNGLKSHSPEDPLIPTDYGDNYGERVRGFIKAPATGNFIFWLTSSNGGELYISTVVPPGQNVSVRTQARAVVAVDYYTSPDTFNVPGQKSQAVPMIKDNLYYFDFFHRANLGVDHWEIRWTLPSENTFATVPASALVSAVPVKPTSPTCPPLAMGGAGAGGAGGGP